MPTASLYSFTREDVPRAVECLKDAFRDDPLWREVFRDDPNKDKSLTAFFTCPLLYGIKFGKACATSPKIEGVAVWVPGRHANMTMWGMLRSGALAYGARMGKESVRNLSIVSRRLGPERRKWMKKKPYLYLTIIGVSSQAQGKGLGSQIMDAIKEECDREGFSLYLETEKEDNLAFYQKHGFAVLEKIVLDKLDLPMWLMERKPQ